MYVSSCELDAVPPYSFELTMQKPASWYWYNPTEIFSEGTLWTALRLSSGSDLGLRLESLGSAERPKVLLTVFSRRKLTDDEVDEAIETVSECAGLREDLRGFYAAAENDSILKYAVSDLYGMRREARPRSRILNFVILALALQNAPIKRTNQMLRLLITKYGGKMFFDNRTTYTWPTPQSIMNTRLEELTEECKLGYRAKYLKSIAEAVFRGECPSLKELAQMPFEEAKVELMKLRGIGEYSAEVILPHPETFPVDSWSTQIFWKLFFPGEAAPSKHQAVQLVRKYAEERWGRWRSQAFVYVLCDLANLSKRLKVDL